MIYRVLIDRNDNMLSIKGLGPSESDSPPTSVIHKDVVYDLWKKQQEDDDAVNTFMLFFPRDPQPVPR